MTDTIVIGAGLAGLSAAIRLSRAGQSVSLLSFGIGGIQLGQGTIDVLGYTSPTGNPVRRPFDELGGHTIANPRHPYNRLDPSRIKAAVDWLADLVPELLVAGDGENHLVVTALGAMRPTYLVQPSMRWPDPASLAVVGPRQIKDFYPDLVAANLAKTAGIESKGYHLDLPARPGEADSSMVVYANALDTAEFLGRFTESLAQSIGDEAAICLPAILGLNTAVHQHLSEALARPVFEALVVPPSIPGMRLDQALTRIAKAAGVRVILGSKVNGFQAANGRLRSVSLRQAGYDKAHTADCFVYAGGGFDSGALAMDSYGQVTETLFGLPLQGLDEDLVTGDYWADQALFAVGVAVDQSMRPVDADSQPVYDNLYAVGGLLSGAIRWTEKSGDGIAVASAVAAADHILGQSTPSLNNEKGNSDV